MIHKTKEILAEEEQCFILENYGIIMTGTPEGGSFLKNEDSCLARILDQEKIILEQKW